MNKDYKLCFWMWKRGEISYYYVDIDIDVGNAYKVEVLEKNDLTKKLKLKLKIQQMTINLQCIL